MKSVPVFTLLFICIISSCVRKTPAPLTREEVIAAIRKFDEGWRTKNLAMVDSVLAPAYVYFTQSGGTFIRDSVVQTAGSPGYMLESMDRAEYEVRLYENTAVVSTRWQGKGSYKGVSFNEDQRCSITIIKHNGKVQILTEHCTPIKHGSIFH